MNHANNTDRYDRRKQEQQAAEEKKIAELRRIQKEVKASALSNMNKPQESQQSSPSMVQKGGSPIRPKFLEQDSEEEDDEEEGMDVNRQISGAVTAQQKAQAHVQTVNYSNSKISPRNILSPNLTMQTNPLTTNKNFIMLGIQETESAEDMEA